MAHFLSDILVDPKFKAVEMNRLDISLALANTEQEDIFSRVRVTEFAN
jgi:hypothetical protein